MLVNIRKGRRILSGLTQEPTKKNRPTRESVQQPQRPGKYLHYEKASEEACSVINLWNAIDGTPNHRLTSKGVEKVLYHLDNDILQKHEPQQIERAIRDLVMMQHDPGLYSVVALGRVSIEDFFLGNGFLKKKGYFKQLIMPGGYKTFLKPSTDPNPESTEKIKKLYQKHILHQDNGATPFTPKQESQFITAARQLRQFMKGKRLEKCLGERTDETEYVMMLFEAIEEEFGKTNFNVGHLASNYTWNDIYPRFISRHWEAE